VVERASVALGFEAPDGSSASSTSSFLTFAGPPPNMEKTLSFTVAAAEAAASAAFSVMGLSLLSAVEVVLVSGWSAALLVVTFAVSSLTRVAPGLAVWSAAGSGLATSDMLW
jgi:hypothetical protein